MGVHHARRLAEIRGAKVAAASDLDGEKLAAFGKEFGVGRLFDDFRGLCRVEELDAVLVCTPPSSHRRITVAAARAGKFVFCEKPSAVTRADARAMIEACRGNKVGLMIGFVRHFDNAWLKFRKLVQDGAIGRPVTWRLITAGSGPHATAWFFDKKMSGGPAIESSVHNFDFGLYTFGPAASVVATTRSMKPVTAVDTFNACVKFKSGDEHLVSWSWSLPPGSAAGRVNDAFGPRGAILFPGSFAPPAGKAGAHALLLDTGGKKRLVRFRGNDMFLDQMRCLVRCVREDAAPPVTGEDGLRALDIAHAVLQAGRTGGGVRVRTA